MNAGLWCHHWLQSGNSFNQLERLYRLLYCAESESKPEPDSESDLESDSEPDSESESFINS